MGRIPARFPAKESALNLSSRVSVATCERFNLVSSLPSVSDNAGGRAGEGVPVAIPPAAIGALSAEEIGFSKGSMRNAPTSGVTLNSGGWVNEKSGTGDRQIECGQSQFELA